MDPERLAEQRRRLPESVYLRLFENQWVTAEDRLVSAADLRACVSLDGPLDPQPRLSYVIGLDIGLKADATIATVCHREPLPDSETGVVVLDRLAVWRGTRQRPVKLGDVEAWLEQAAREYRGATIVADPWQAVGLLQRLRSRGVRIEEFPFSAQSVGRLASTLHLLLREHALALPDDEALLDELAHVRLREVSPGVLRLDHDSGRHDDRAIALALAAFKLVERPQSSPMRISRSRARLPRPHERPLPPTLVAQLSAGPRR
jgi:phage FluMu gp28-like protein